MSEAIIQLTGISRVYRRRPEPEVRALHGITLEIHRGEFVAIRGASGSGKSSLLNVIGCLDRPTSGSYRLNGTEVKAVADQELSRIRNEQIGFVFQAFHLLSRTTALENVLIPQIYSRRPIDWQRGVQALTRVGLASRTKHHPTELSGGEQQRVAVARALINSPPLILADEPTGNLDRAAGAAVMALLASLNQDGHTVILVTHDDAVARLARRTVQLRDGAVVADDAG